MQFLVVLKDHIDVTHKQYEMEFTTETTMAQMKDEIASLFDVPSQYQRLFHENGNPIGRADLNGPISQMGLHHMDVLVVTHGQLEMWITYTDLVRDFANCQYSASKQTIAETAMDHFNSMSKGKLFSGYSAFYKEFSKLHAPISKYLDKQTKWIKAAACSYFKLSMFRGQNPKLKFEPTFDGSRSAVVCIVNLESAERKFRIKTNHDAKVSSTAASFNINLIEMFLYKLFESINIGSKITFIPNCVLSKSIIYIASEWIPNLKTINDIHEDDLGNLTEEIVQLHFLAVFLTLGDLHEENFGFFEKKLKILDFMCSDYCDMKNVFLNKSNVIKSIAARSILDTCTPMQRLDIARNSVTSWDLVSKFDEVLELMEKEKIDFCRNDLDFAIKTNDLLIYVEKAKKHIQELFED